jgi:pimeloyl-ACP methyl ester carboxylesterase
MRDAVVLVPGIMGSELRSRDGRILWGMNWRTLADARIRWRLHSELRVRPEDLDVDPYAPLSTRRVYAFQPLVCAASFPFWSQEPYTGISRDLKNHLPDGAFKAFAYDWRLPVTFNAIEFAHRAKLHLTSWRRANIGTDPEEIKLVVVAHSMGGLVAWHALQADPDLHHDVRSLVTLGTPFGGALSALQTLADDGRATPPRLTTPRAARELARTCPGVYDLLPRDECVLDGQPRRLTAGDVSEVGGNKGLAQEAIQRRANFELSHPHNAVAMSMLAGTGQDTAAQIRWDRTHARFLFDEILFGSGDATVVEHNALAADRPEFKIPQTHAALAAGPEGITFARKRMLGQDIGQALAMPGLNVVLDDCQLAGTVSLTVKQPTGWVPTEVTSTPAGLRQITRWSPRRRDDTWLYEAVLPPGIHRVFVHQRGFSPITHLLCVEQGDPK